MARGKVLGKSILLIILIIILVIGGLLWFDHLGVLQVKKVFGPLYKAFGRDKPVSSAVDAGDPSMYANLDDDRLAKRLEALEIKKEELNQREANLQTSENENMQLSQELMDKQTSLEEREKTFNDLLKQQDKRQENIVQITQYLTGMQPSKAVAIMIEMSDQDVIDVMRQADKNAAAEDTTSMVSYWLSLMPSDRAAEIQRKMANKPATLD